MTAIFQRPLEIPGKIIRRLRAIPVRLRADRLARERHARVLQALRDKPPQRILFVCFGNICRSPLAEVIARQTFGDGIQVESAGLYRKSNRESPANMHRAAEKLSVSLVDHRSSELTEERLSRSDLILIMDHDNLAQFAAEFPAFADRVGYLGPFDGSSVVIRDPYDKDDDETLAVASQIRAAVQGLASVIRSRRA